MLANDVFRPIWWLSLIVVLVLGLCLVTRALRPRRVPPRVADEVAVAMARVRANLRRQRKQAAIEYASAVLRRRQRGAGSRRR